MADTRDIFMYDNPIYEAFQWYDLTLLEHIIHEVGDDLCASNLNDYKAILKEYIASRREIDLCNDSIASPVRIMIDMEWDSVFMEEEDQELVPKRYIASLLNLKEERLSFVPMVM